MKWLKTHWRWLVLALGLVAVVMLVRKVGVQRVVAVLLEAGPWLPVVLVLEGAWMMGSDIIALRALAGDKRRDIPLGGLLRATALAYALTILAPSGRAAGEVARGAFLSRYLGASRATAIAAHMHGSSLIANGLACLAAFVGVSLSIGPTSTLGLFVVANVVFVSLVGSGIVALARSPRVGAWLAKKATRFGIHVKHEPAATAGPSSVALSDLRRAIFSIWGGRCVQAFEYGIILMAVGGAVGVLPTLTAHAVHLVGANLGDLVPGQMGVTESSYSAFAPALGFADAPARALAIPLIVRISQLLLAVGCMVITAVMPDRGPTPAAAEAKASG